MAKEIHGEYIKCSEGGKCGGSGAELGYSHVFEAGQHETDEPLLDENKTRKWNILSSQEDQEQHAPTLTRCRLR